MAATRWAWNERAASGVNGIIRSSPPYYACAPAKDGTAADGRHKLVGIVHGAAESVYRVEGLSADDLEDVEDVRIEAEAVGPGHQAIQNRYRLDKARGNGKTLTEEAEEPEDAFLAGTTTDRG